MNEKTQRIIAYLCERHAPHTIIVYGSFADGTNGEGSDFDALAIADAPSARHDESIVDGTVLDVFLYDTEALAGNVELDKFIQLYDGIAALDARGMGKALIERVRAHVDEKPRKTRAENEQAVAWCEKMLVRAARGDAEGFFRWHWLLTESLEIYCDVRGIYYQGPKKALIALARDDQAAFAAYSAALADFTSATLAAWVAHMRAALDGSERSRVTD